MKAEKLVSELRYAENCYQKTGDPSKKEIMLSKLEKVNLTQEEQEEFNSVCKSLGI